MRIWMRRGLPTKPGTDWSLALALERPGDAHVLAELGDLGVVQDRIKKTLAHMIPLFS
jgi:hypothetical protein